MKDDRRVDTFGLRTGISVYHTPYGRIEDLDHDKRKRDAGKEIVGVQQAEGDSAEPCRQVVAGIIGIKFLEQQEEDGENHPSPEGLFNDWDDDDFSDKPLIPAVRCCAAGNPKVTRDNTAVGEKHDQQHPPIVPGFPDLESKLARPPHNNKSHCDYEVCA